jgi:hypothetical protein
VGCFVIEVFARGHGFKGTAARDSGGYLLRLPVEHDLGATVA